jgi:hypothetical protein
MKLVFSLSAGRTGTAFLAELIARNLDQSVAAEVYHERLGFDAFGVDTPDLSHMVQFNSRGNTEKIQQFWNRKLDSILAGDLDFYAETSHPLMKAGLVENAVRVCRDRAELHFVRLRRSLVPTLLSYERRGDFLNKSSQWLWYLDDAYPRVLVKPEAFRRAGLVGIMLWYLLEIEFRGAYYMERHKSTEGVFFHEADIDALNDAATAATLLSDIYGKHNPESVVVPGKKNATENAVPADPERLDLLEQLVAKTAALDPVANAKEYVAEGVDPFAAE